MGHHVETDITVQRFGYTGDADGKRLLFPHAETKAVEGRSGGVVYGATDCMFENLEGRIDMLRWKADAASVGAAYLRDDHGRYDVGVERLEFPRGIMLVDADKGVEILAPHVSFSELRIDIKFTPRDDQPAKPVSGAVLPVLRQSGKLRLFDSLQGQINGRLEVKLDLPVLGKRTLDQELRIAIVDGSLDFRALDESLDWLEGAFLDIESHDERLAVRWKVPIFGARHDLISWALDKDAATLATFGRVPVRSLVDFRFGDGAEVDPDSKKRQILQAFAIKAIDIAVSLAPRIVETSSGAIMFGGDDQPGVVDLKVTGEVKDTGPGSLHGAIGSIDTTIKDVRFGPVRVTADRLTFDGLDQLEVTFDGFRPVSAKVVIHRVTATNLSFKIGGG